MGDEWAFFSGTFRTTGTPDPGQGELMAENGLIVELGGGWTGQTMEATDPRMTGSRSERFNRFETLAGSAVSEPGAIWSSYVTIESTDGSWTCELAGSGVGDLGSESGWCEGSGGYVGLRAYVTFDVDQSTSGLDTVPFFGYISSGDAPPMPEAPTG